MENHCNALVLGDKDLREFNIKSIRNACPSSGISYQFLKTIINLKNLLRII
jgi:hypothetical protein